jgi:pyruvate dehydrogenase E2 component (dihydrolipoamide acetyltransferase)
MEITINLPELGEGVDNVDVVEVLISVGESIEEDQGLIEVETEKASVEVPSTAAGTVTEVHVSVGDVLSANAKIVTLEGTEGQADAAPPVPAPESAPENVEEKTGGREANSKFEIRNSKSSTIPASPRVRRFAREIGVDLSIVSGTGAGGRISIDDVKAHGKRLLSQQAPESTSFATAELPDLERFGRVRREPMSKVRRLTAENLTRAWLTAPQVTNHEIADITDLEKFRKAYKERVESAGGKLTMTAILVKIVASAIKQHPTLNAAVDMVNYEIVFRESINIGVAVDTERGLLVPVIRDADGKDLTEIAVELDDLARRAREKKLMPDHMQGGTFSISNLGGIGGTGFSPIVNWPEVAILGVSRARIEPEWHDDEFRPRLMMPLSLSYDHRLVDGADAARFLARLKDALEQPMLLALNG